MSLFRSNALERDLRRKRGGLGQLRSRYMKRPLVLSPEQERRRKQVARITPQPRYMDVPPKPGDWCLYKSGPDNPEAPLVCFDTYQEALEFPVSDIPTGQGVDHAGRQRLIRCQSEPLGSSLDPQGKLPFNRKDGFYIGQVKNCRHAVSPWPLKRW